MASNALSSTVAPGSLDPAARQAREDFLRQLNLRPIHARAQELAGTLNSIIVALIDPERQQGIQWQETMDLFGLVNLQLHQLMQQLSLQLKYNTVFPKAVNETNAPQLPVLLATKLLPEMEAQHLHLQARHAADAGHLNLIDQIARTDMQASHLNSVIALVTQHAQHDSNSGILDPKGPYRQAAVSKLKALLAAKPVLQAAAPGQDSADAFLTKALGRQQL